VDWFKKCAALLCAACIWAGAGDDGAKTESLLREQARLRPDSFAANRALAQLYLRQRKVAAAIPLLESARRVNPQDYDNCYDLALAYLETGSTAKSREIATGLLARGDKAELHNLLGEIEEKEGRIEAAAAQYEIAARMDPSEKNLFDLGSYLLRHQGFQPALKVFEFGAGRHPQSAKLRVGLGIAYYSLGKYSDAVESLCEAVDLDPKDARAIEFLGKMYDVAPELSAEVSVRLARFADLHPDNAAAAFYYALSLRGRNIASFAARDVGKAEALLRRAVKLDPNFAEAHCELGLLYEDEGQEAEALREFELAVKLRPDLAKVHYRLARLYSKQGRFDLAEKEYRAFDALKKQR
jgi:tetratricopeptide (TPR) repeat protein